MRGGALQRSSAFLERCGGVLTSLCLSLSLPFLSLPLSRRRHAIQPRPCRVSQRSSSSRPVGVCAPRWPEVECPATLKPPPLRASTASLVPLADPSLGRILVPADQARERTRERDEERAARREVSLLDRPRARERERERARRLRCPSAPGLQSVVCVPPALLCSPLLCSAPQRASSSAHAPSRSPPVLVSAQLSCSSRLSRLSVQAPVRPASRLGWGLPRALARSAAVEERKRRACMC